MAVPNRSTVHRMLDLATKEQVKFLNLAAYEQPDLVLEAFSRQALLDANSHEPAHETYLIPARYRISSSFSLASA